jgi:hypothetical protein
MAEAKIKIAADIDIATQKLFLGLLKYYNTSKVGLITQLIQLEANRLGIK